MSAQYSFYVVILDHHPNFRYEKAVCHRTKPPLSTAMTPRETVETVSSTTSAYSSRLATTTALPSNHTCRDRSSSLVKVDLKDTKAGSRCSSPMPNENGDSGKRSASLMPDASFGLQTKNSKKRRRIGVVCRTHSPVVRATSNKKTWVQSS